MAIEFVFKGKAFVKPVLTAPKVQAEKVDRPDSVEGPDGLYITAEHASKIMGFENSNMVSQRASQEQIRSAKLGKFLYVNQEDIDAWKATRDERLELGFKDRSVKRGPHNKAVTAE